MTDTLITNRGPTVPDVYMVSADQETIIGNGTTENPLRAGPGGGGGTFQAAFRGSTPAPFPGMPVFIALFSQVGGITTVQQTDVRAGEPQFSQFANVAGIVTAVNGDGTVQVQASGNVTLTTTQWDFATGNSGGLSLGDIYYPIQPAGAGITATPPSSPGSWKTRVGVALNSTTMLLEVSPPVQILGDSIYFATNIGSAPVVGTVVAATGTAKQVTPAANNGTIAAAAAVGVIAVYASGVPVVQTAGIVALTTSQWDAVTGGSGGLTPGTPYYVGVSGHLTVTRPTTPGEHISIVGIAISTTLLLLATPCVPLTA